MTHIMHVAPFVCLLQAKQSNNKRTKNKSNKIMLPSIMNNCDDHSNSNSGHQKSCNWYMKSVTLQLLLLFVTVTTFKIKNRLLQRLFSFSSLLFQKMYSLFAFHSFAFRCLPFNQMLHYFTELCCHHKFTMSNKHRSKNWSKNCSGSIRLTLLQKAKRVLIQTLLIQFKFAHSITNTVVYFVSTPSPTFQRISSPQATTLKRR